MGKRRFRSPVFGSFSRHILDTVPPLVVSLSLALECNFACLSAFDFVENIFSQPSCGQLKAILGEQGNIRLGGYWQSMKWLTSFTSVTALVSLK